MSASFSFDSRSRSELLASIDQEVVSVVLVVTIALELLSSGAVAS